ncbi:dual specificity mitogen-activated protein kinase kinase 3-like isoform X2 [Varroa jacobsoni]|uniref:dual specificity mitogen-activated protein kinase kinase 3-like isoform X2 n=1 Tax=Varroa jacobsoni TaxID=62625 RepID=UPI000BF2EC99|nr:dual specificity mitogen-activated protein kinase kinase 3-like isoform X2 [Varroa jacobsoni]
MNKRAKKLFVPKLKIAEEPPLEDDIAPPNLNSIARIQKDGKEVTVNADELDKVRELGRGAYGVVDLMKHKSTGLFMAVKRIRYTFDEMEKRRALMDLDVSMKAHCLHTVRFYGALFHDGDIWICMEKMDSSLDKFYLAAFRCKGGVPEPVLAKIAYSIVTALDYLKRNLKIMHRDVKPSNVLVNREGSVKLCDFGISGKMVDSVAKSNLGCKPYMPPERIQAEPGATYDVRSDVWSLGITMLEIATGQFPYARTTNDFEQLKQVVESPPPKLPKGTFSIHFHEFIELCLQKNREQRARYPALLETAFISKGSKADISAFVQEVIEPVP